MSEPVAPATHSFRRHVLFEMDDRGRIGEKVEIVMPGESSARVLLSNRRFSVA